jgi:hypothetical protein
MDFVPEVPISIPIKYVGINYLFLLKIFLGKRLRQRFPNFTIENFSCQQKVLKKNDKKKREIGEFMPILFDTRVIHT